MAEERVERKLAEILVADVAGYSRLVGDDEMGTRARFIAHLNELIEPAIAIRPAIDRVAGGWTVS